ncbi:hypothetical protein NC796_18170 [Aliifodinibius sp. S!AR15-10]|uniref:hypothetical protein n=1 Tax=Aliifodinibius sp. S!AR15-10 TaxID=2950437 RepID=UPI002860FC29|nr:hypothetical protein [Aliifodinibius sp. S!AR15-10]MDR8393088.1 hypothetical protein [Aliifodinibius sp. S!AR15-10]
MEKIKLKIDWKLVGSIFLLTLVMMGFLIWLVFGNLVFTLPVLSIIAVGWAAIAVFISLIVYSSQPPLALGKKGIHIGRKYTRQIHYKDVTLVRATPEGMKIHAGQESVIVSNFYANYNEGQDFLEQKLSGRIREESYNQQLITGVVILGVILTVLSLLS